MLDPGFSRLCLRASIFQFRDCPGLRCEEGWGLDGTALQGEKRCVLMMVSLERNGKAQRDSLWEMTTTHLKVQLFCRTHIHCLAAQSLRL